MNTYVIRVGDEFLKRINIGSDGEIKVYYAKLNDSMFFTIDIEKAKNIANLIGGEVEEITK